MSRLVSRPGDIRELFIKAQMEPLCGWPWLDENRGKVYPEQGITVFHNGKALLDVPSTSKRSIKGIMEMARSA
jgi:hypothetical protein